MFLHYLDFILMALDLIRGLMKLMQLFNEDWIRPCNWVRLCNGWRASKTIPLPLGEHLLRRLVRNKLPLHHKWKMTYGHPPCPKACAPWFKARQNLRPNCEKQNVKEAKKKKPTKHPPNIITSQSDPGLLPFQRVSSKSATKTSYLMASQVWGSNTFTLKLKKKRVGKSFLIGMQHKESDTQNGIIQNDNCIVAFSGY